MFSNTLSQFPSVSKTGPIFTPVLNTAEVVVNLQITNGKEKCTEPYGSMPSLNLICS